MTRSHPSYTTLAYAATPSLLPKSLGAFLRFQSLPFALYAIFQHNSLPALQADASIRLGNMLSEASLCGCHCHLDRKPNKRLENNPIKILDLEIVRLRRALQETSAYRNRLVPVNRLPPELLQHIFHLVVSSHPLDSRTLDLKMTAFSEVCQYWRGAALESAVLWTCPRFERPTLASAALDRSKTMPLDFRCSLPLRTKDGLQREALTQRHRIQSLCFFLDEGRNGFRSLSEAMRGSFPVLRNFSLYCLGNNEPSSTLPEEVLAAVASDLQRLMLHGVRLPEGFQTRFTSLTVLIINANRQTGGIFPFDMIETFRQNSGLRTVKLREALDWNAQSADQLVLSKPKLPFLEELTLHEMLYAKAISYVLGALDISIDLSLDVRTFYNDHDEDEVEALTKAIAAVANASTNDGIRYIEIARNGGTLHFFGWSAGACGCRPTLILHSCFSLWAESHVNSGIRTLSKGYPILSARHWNITGNVDSKGWHLLLASPNVDISHLRLDSESTPGFLRSFIQESMLLSVLKLEILVMEGVDFAQLGERASSSYGNLDLLLTALDGGYLHPTEVRMVGCCNLPAGFSDAFSVYEWVKCVVVSDVASHRVDPLEEEDMDEWLDPRKGENVVEWFRDP